MVESKEETTTKLIETTKKFFKEQMEIEDDIDILDVFRRGRRGIRDRPICVKLQHVSDKAVIFTNASKLKDKTNTRKKLFMVRDDQDDKSQEVRGYFRDLQQENKSMDDDQKKTIKVTRGEIFVNNHKVRSEIE